MFHCTTTTVVIQSYIKCKYTLSCRTRYSHSSSYTYTPTLRRHWTPETSEFKSPSMLLFVSAVQLYCALLCNCTRMVGGLLVGGWCYCCTAVLLLHCLAVTLASRRPLARSIAPSIAPSITRRHRRPGVVGLPSSIARRRPIARSLARPPSLTRRRRRRSGGLWPPSSLARRRPLVRSPAVVRSFARRRSPAVALVCVYELSSV